MPAPGPYTESPVSVFLAVQVPSWSASTVHNIFIQLVLHSHFQSYSARLQKSLYRLAPLLPKEKSGNINTWLPITESFMKHLENTGTVHLKLQFIRKHPHISTASTTTYFFHFQLFNNDFYCFFCFNWFFSFSTFFKVAGKVLTSQHKIPSSDLYNRMRLQCSALQ